jgi:Flp pilus assembly protein TadG
MGRRAGTDIHKAVGGTASALRRALKAAISASASVSSRSLLLRFRRDQSGGYLIMSALLMPVLVGSAALGTEVGLWLYMHQRMQGAADLGAVSAALAYSNDHSSNLALEAGAVTASYNFVADVNNVAVTVNRPPLSGNHTGTPGAVEVIVQQPQAPLLTALWSSTPVSISARAVAVSNTDGLGCVLALDHNASGAITSQGNSKVNLRGCSLFDDSANATALTNGGSATITALSVGVVGGVSGTSGITTTQGITTGMSAVSDPYASVSMPSFSGCSHTNFTAHTTVTIDPGVYCGGIGLNANANVTLNPGIYYLDQGSLSVNGGAVMSGDGVTLVFTSSSGSNYATATINGGATVNLSAPTSGPMAGIVMYGDRNMPAGTAFKFNGGASQTLHGAIYFPKGSVSFAGGANTGDGCMQLVADTITFTGDSNFAINCSGSGTKPIATAAVTLVE